METTKNSVVKPTGKIEDEINIFLLVVFTGGMFLHQNLVNFIPNSRVSYQKKIRYLYFTVGFTTTFFSSIKYPKIESNV